MKENKGNKYEHPVERISGRSYTIKCMPKHIESYQKRNRMCWTYIILIICIILCGIVFLICYLKHTERIGLDIKKYHKQIQLQGNISRLKEELEQMEKEPRIVFPENVQDSCPIKIGTTTIVYSYHSNSGQARYTTIYLHSDSLIWYYMEVRNKCFLKDVCKYDRAEFDKLLKDLSVISFSGTFGHDDNIWGREGYALSFEVDSQRYLYYSDLYRLSGDYSKVYNLIQQFVETHKTQCEIFFEKCSSKPHNKAQFGEFQTLPIELQRYKYRVPSE